MPVRRRFTRRRLLVATTVLACSAIGYGLHARYTSPQPAKRYETLDWWDRFDGDLALRSSGAGALLMALLRYPEPYTLEETGAVVPSDTVYYFRPDPPDVFRATKEEWATAPGKITDASSQRFTQSPITPFEFDFQNYTLRWNSKMVDAFGSKVMQVCAAPDGIHMAVVSTNAWAMPAIIEFGSVVNSRVFYHQVFNRQTGAPVGPTLSLVHNIRMCRPEICWSEDSKYVVYVSSGSYHLWIVPVDDTATAGEN